MLVGFADAGVRAAARPQAIGSADEALAMTVLARSPHLAHLLTLESLRLTRLADSPFSDYHFGTTAVGVSFRPVDRRGTPLATRHIKENLMQVTAVTVLEIGLALEEAQTA